MYAIEYSSATRKKEILSFTTAWMDLSGIVLSEVSQRKTNRQTVDIKQCMISHTFGIF